VLTGVHVGLLVVMLAGLAAPVSVLPVLRARLAARYTETLTDDLRAHGELAAYAEIRREFGGSRMNPALISPLAGVVTAIDGVSRPPDGQQDATSTDLDLARRAGELQAAALALRSPPVAQDAGTVPAGDTSEQLGDLSTEEKQDARVREQVNDAAELTATAVSQALRIPRLGDAEVVQIIREYLSGLIEFSPLKDVFAGWVDKLRGGTAPPPARDIVVPDPAKLKDAAAAQMKRNWRPLRSPIRQRPTTCSPRPASWARSTSSTRPATCRKTRARAPAARRRNSPVRTTAPDPTTSNRTTCRERTCQQARTHQFHPPSTRRAAPSFCRHKKFPD
jgi:hypothetical protein